MRIAYDPFAAKDAPNEFGPEINAKGKVMGKLEGKSQ
jgi:hypothetical protein